MKSLKLLGFTILMVGTVVGYLPYWLRSQYPQELELWSFKYLGWLFILFGVLLRNRSSKSLSS